MCVIMSKVEKRLSAIKDMFLDPKMSNLGLLEEQIHHIWEYNKAIMAESSVRVGSTSGVSYADMVSEAEIPEEPVKFEQMLDELSFYYKGLIKWNSPGVMINITPPPLISSVAATACGNMFNPNLAMDVPSGNMAFAEMEVMKMVCDLVKWDYNKASGFMTFGGKSTVLYAIRAGLNSCLPKTRYQGLLNEKVKVFSTEQGHPCHYENCEWLGIGSDNCVRVPVNDNGQMNLDILKDELEKCIMYGEKIACIIVNGGSTLYTTIDEIAKVVEMRKSLMDKYALDYCPHIHVDSVSGWAWLMFESYDFIQNPLEFSEDAIVELKYVYNHVKDISLADSFGVDFHKTGYSPYLCSMFICKDKQKVFNLGEPKQATMDDMVYGIYAPFTFTLESSRAGVSALEAWISLKQLGKGGYQRIIGTLVETGCSLRKHFDNADYSICRNNDAHGFVALVMLLPFELRTSLKTNIESFSDEELLKIAKYNHKFYLYALQLSVRNEIPFLLDYVSKQTTIREIKIGVMKFFPMSPFCNEDYLESFYSEFKAILDKFDEVWETMELTDSPFRPKPFVTR